MRPLLRPLLWGLLGGGIVVVVGLLLWPRAGVSRPLTTSEIDALVRDAMHVWGVPGAAVAVVRDDEVIYLQGHGVKELGRSDPVTPDTLFPIASCTKGFTTAAMAMLADEGKLSWDDPVRKHVPYFRLHDPASDAAVNLRDLVTHRTGLRNHDLLWYHSSLPQEELIRRVAYLTPDKPFRTTFQYQSTMFTTAGRAVASASGRPWGEFVRERLFEPLGMKTATVTTAAAAKAPDHATGHRRRDDRVEVEPWYQIEEPDAAGSICVSARDLAVWARFQLGDGTWEGKRLLSAASMTELHTPQIVLRLEGQLRDMNPDTLQMSYGLGWLIYDYRGHLLWAHAGTIDGFRSYITLVPEKKLAVVLLNNLHQVPMNLPLSNSLLDRLLDLPHRDWNGYFVDAERRKEQAALSQMVTRAAARHPGTKPSRPQATFAGTYEHPAYGSSEVVVQDGSLAWRWNRIECLLEHYHYDTFLPRHDLLRDAEVQFLFDADGEVNGLKVTGVIGVEFKRVKQR